MVSFDKKDAERHHISFCQLPWDDLEMVRQLSDLNTERITAFVDIMGIKNWISNPKQDPSEQENILDAMDIIHSYKEMNDDFMEEGKKEYVDREMAGNPGKP